MITKMTSMTTTESEKEIRAKIASFVLCEAFERRFNKEVNQALVEVAKVIQSEATLSQLLHGEHHEFIPDDESEIDPGVIRGAVLAPHMFKDEHLLKAYAAVSICPGFNKEDEDKILKELLLRMQGVRSR